MKNDHTEPVRGFDSSWDITASNLLTCYVHKDTFDRISLVQRNTQMYLSG